MLRALFFFFFLRFREGGPPRVLQATSCTSTTSDPLHRPSPFPCGKSARSAGQFRGKGHVGALDQWRACTALAAARGGSRREQPRASVAPRHSGELEAREPGTGNTLPGASHYPRLSVHDAEITPGPSHTAPFSLHIPVSSAIS